MSRLAPASRAAFSGLRLLRAVHGLVGLIGQHLAPSETTELPPQLEGGQPEFAEIVVHRKLESFEPAGNRERWRSPEKTATRSHRSAIGIAEERGGLGFTVGSEDLVHRQGRDHHTLGVAQRHRLADGQTSGDRLIDIEGHRQRPETRR